MLKIRMDYSKADYSVIEYDNSEIFNEDFEEYNCNMKTYICDILFDSGVEYLYDDNDVSYHSIYGCDDVLFFFDDYETNMELINNKRDFIFDSYEQGSEICLKFYYKRGKYNVKIDHNYGKQCSEETLDYDYVKNMFYSLFDSIFEFVSKKCKGIDDDKIYNRLKEQVYKIKL